MEYSSSVWNTYQPGWVPPEFVPYLKFPVRDGAGNQIKINTWTKQGTPDWVYPELVRINKGLTFQRMFYDDPCPNGWIKSEKDMGYCVREELRHEPVFYSGKAFIPKRQYFAGYADAGSGYDVPPRRISEQTDMRSVNPLTGEYQIYYEPTLSRGPRSYAKPRTDDIKKYDTSWGLPRHTGYMKMASTDSFLA